MNEVYSGTGARAERCKVKYAVYVSINMHRPSSLELMRQITICNTNIILDNEKYRRNNAAY